MEYCNGCMYRLRGTLFVASLFPNSSFLPGSSIPFAASSEAQLQFRLLTLYICQVWVLQHSHRSSFIPFPRCALSLLSLALLTWLLCDNSCWKAFSRATATHFPSQLSPCPSAPSMALPPGRGWCLPWGLSTKHPGKADFYNSLNSQRVGLPSIYFSFYPASKGSPICRQYLALPDKLHLYRLIQTQAINTRRLCTDCRHSLSVPLPGPTFLQAFRRIRPGILMLPWGCAMTRLSWDEAWKMWLDLCECCHSSGADRSASPFYT